MIAIPVAILGLSGVMAIVDRDATDQAGCLFGVALCLPVILATRRLCAPPQARLQHRRTLMPAMAETNASDMPLP